LDKLGDRGPAEEIPFRSLNFLENGGENPGIAIKFSGRVPGAIDGINNFAQRDLIGGPSEAIATGGPPSAINEPRTLKVKEDLN
jgi:hypothetical protein